MTEHLSSQEIVEALDGALGADRLGHLDACGACRDERDAWRALVAGVEAARDVPEPPPFFWERLSADVRRRTTAVAPSPWSAWRASWQPIAALAVVAVASVVMMTVRGSFVSKTAPTAAPAMSAPVASAPSGADVDAQWALVEQTASTLSEDEVVQVASSAPSLDNAVQLDQLTPAERATFARLVTAELDRE